MDKVKWGIIGCGDVTEVKSGPALQLANESELVAVMRRNSNLAKDYARRHKVAKWYDNADDLINEPDVNAVYIATPPSSHKEYTIKAAQAGKAVYVEKPMALSYSECLEMIAVCKKLSVPLFVAYYRRALPRFLFIKEHLDKNVIGDILTVNCVFRQQPDQKDNDPNNWRVNEKIAGCGYFCDLASHMFDLLLYYLGAVDYVSGHSSKIAANYSTEDTVIANMRFKSNVLFAGEWSFSASENLDRTEINGTKGKIIYSVFNHAAVVVQVNGKSSEYNIDHPKHIQQPLIQNIVDELLGKTKSPSTGESAAVTNYLIDNILGRI